MFLFVKEIALCRNMRTHLSFAAEKESHYKPYVIDLMFILMSFGLLECYTARQLEFHPLTFHK